jgi:hypothetical protein
MLGFGDKHHHIDPTTLPIFVYALQSTEAFGLAQKVWENNLRYVMFDAGNNKELLRFVFNDPACVVWLERDKNRTDTFEMVLLWDAADNKENVSEVYVLSAQTAAPVGDDARAKSLLSTILSSPAIVPVSNNPNSQAGAGQAPAAS